LLDVLRPLIADGAFFVDLRRAGNVTEDSTLPAIPLGTLDQPRAIPGRAPNIFFIVIDSLRPDYLSAYNPIVTFTPAIGAFAADSIVMRQAFTSYAGTALSEPALWAGGLIPRAMYIKPFSPMNNLERLVRLGAYRPFISVDGILSTILEDRTGVTRLDARLTHPARPDEAFKFDLCATLTELADRLDHDARTGPVFFYSQPQNLHIRMLVPEGVQMPRFEGLQVGSARFFKPAANVIGRLDACFGDFIGHLKSTGSYDDSIIVLTSDHGDAYGDANRWGHAFHLAPETVRIPLIIHVPERLRSGRAWDANAVAMSIDITPTLYDLLGYRLSDRSGVLGRSLMPRASEKPRPANDAFLVESSYGQVYGLIDGRGRWLYAADVNREREQFYDLINGGPYPDALASADRLQYRKWLQDRIEQVNRFYGRPPRD
jgi:arylsulfatase A-like enzyme